MIDPERLPTFHDRSPAAARCRWSGGTTPLRLALRWCRLEQTIGLGDGALP